MTPARTASYGLGNPPPLYRLIDAVLMLFAELVSHAASTLQMVLVHSTRDWHTEAASKDLPRATSGIHQEPQTSQPSFTGKAAGCIPGIPVFSTQGTTTYSLCALNQDARHKAEHGFVSNPRPLPVIPAAARKRPSAPPAASLRINYERENRGDTHPHDTQVMGSCFRRNDDQVVRVRQA